MASETADDVIKELAGLATDRLPYDDKWQQVAELAAPDAGDFRGAPHSFLSDVAPSNLPRQAIRSELIYDNTAAWCVDRLAPGIEALIAPQSEYWHSYKSRGIDRRVDSDEMKLYYEDLRNAVFDVRYDMDSGWSKTLQTCIRRTIAFGTALMFVEEGWDDTALIRYRYMPLNESYIATDAYDFVNTFARQFLYTAAQAVEKYGEKNVSPAIVKAAQHPQDKYRKFRFIHRIGPRGDFGRSVDGIGVSRFSSVHVEVDTRTVVKSSGFFSFPIIDFRWTPEPGNVYAEGLLMRVLAEIQSLNLLAKNELTVSEQAVRPALLVADAGIMNRPTNHPGEVIYGGISPNGHELVKAMNSGVRLDFARAIIEAKQHSLKESMYINLFQILVENPRMSATEALIRANEKGELLGPAGSGLQGSLARANDRELTILEMKGMFAPDSEYAPPQDLNGKKITPEFTSPLDRLRRTKEGEATMRMLEVMSPVMQIDQTVARVFDGHEMARGLGDIFGVPRRFIRSREVVDADLQAEQQAAQMQMAAQAATAGKQGSEALANLQQTGL